MTCRRCYRWAHTPWTSICNGYWSWSWSCMSNAKKKRKIKILKEREIVMVYFIFYFNILLLFSVQFLTDYKNLRIFGRKIRPWWGPILQFKSLGVNVSKGPIFMTRRNRLYWTASPAQSHGTDEAQLELLAKQVQTQNLISIFHFLLSKPT